MFLDISPTVLTIWLKKTKTVWKHVAKICSLYKTVSSEGRVKISIVKDLISKITTRNLNGTYTRPKALVQTEDLRT